MSVEVWVRTSEAKGNIMVLWWFLPFCHQLLQVKSGIIGVGNDWKNSGRQNSGEKVRGWRFNQPVVSSCFLFHASLASAIRRSRLWMACSIWCLSYSAWSVRRWYHPYKTPEKRAVYRMTYNLVSSEADLKRAEACIDCWWGHDSTTRVCKGGIRGGLCTVKCISQAAMRTTAG